MRNEIILIIDGTNLMHRNHFAYPENLTDQNGNRTGAIYGTIKQLVSFSKEFNPKQIYICLDISRNTFRREQYPEYKNNRKDTDPALKSQFKLLEEFCSYANIPYVQLINYEADDLIGSLAKNSVKYGFSPYVISGDRDIFQLIDENITVKYISKHGLETYDLDMLAKNYNNLTPEQFIDLKALMGDKSDNIPGVTGVGEKTAINLLTEYKSLDNIYENTDKLKGKLKENIINCKDLAYLSKKLATIVYNLDIDYNYFFEILSDIKYDFENDKVKSFLNRLNIKSL